MANDSSVFDSNSGQDCESTEKFKKIPVTRRNGEGMLPSWARNVWQLNEMTIPAVVLAGGVILKILK